MWQWLLAASPDSLNLPGYGIAGITIAGLSGAVLKMWNALQAKDVVIDGLHKAALDREREMNEKTIPVLAETARTMALIPPALDRSLAAAETSTRSSELRHTVEQVLREQSPPRQ